MAALRRLYGSGVYCNVKRDIPWSISWHRRESLDKNDLAESHGLLRQELIKFRESFDSEQRSLSCDISNTRTTAYFSHLLRRRKILCRINLILTRLSSELCARRYVPNLNGLNHQYLPYYYYISHPRRKFKETLP